jgi:hypothetical protein
MWHAWERRGMCTGFWCEGQKERDHSEDQGVGGRMRSEWILGKLAGEVWSGFSWLRKGAGDGLFGCCDVPSGSGAMELIVKINLLIVVVVKCCFLCGRNWIIKEAHYLLNGLQTIKEQDFFDWERLGLPLHQLLPPPPPPPPPTKITNTVYNFRTDVVSLRFRKCHVITDCRKLKTWIWCGRQWRNICMKFHIRRLHQKLRCEERHLTVPLFSLSQGKWDKMLWLRCRIRSCSILPHEPSPRAKLRFFFSITNLH